MKSSLNIHMLLVLFNVVLCMSTYGCHDGRKSSVTAPTVLSPFSRDVGLSQRQGSMPVPVLQPNFEPTGSFTRGKKIVQNPKRLEPKKAGSFS